MATNEFEFTYNGMTVYTGTKVPETYPLSFKPFPEKKVRPVEDILEIIKNPKRRDSRKRWPTKRLINQGRRSSCNAYMAAAMWMRAHWLATGIWVEVSPEFMYMHINGGRDQGSMLDDGMVFMTDVGFCKKEIDGDMLIPYQSYRKSDIGMEQMRFATQDAVNQRAGECYQMPNGTPEQCWAALLSCLAGRGVVGLAVQVGNNYMRSGEIAGFDRGPGNHAVCGDDIVALTRNPRGVEDFGIRSPQSWDKSFADGGWTILKIEHIAQTCKYHGIYGLRSTLTSRNDISQTRIK